MRLTAVVAGVALALVMLAGLGSAQEAGPGSGARAPDTAMEPEPGDTAPPEPRSTEPRSTEPRSTDPHPLLAPGAAPHPRETRRGCDWPERTLAIGPAQEPLHVGLETYPQTLQLGDHEVVLTFDDGPSAQTTPRVLEALDAACVHATFFLIGRHAAKYPALARRELDEGHTVGHHSNTHPTFTLRGFDQASAEVDIDAGVMAVERALYGAKAQSPKHPHTPFFRFPGFADTDELLHFLDERHYTVFGTDMWAKDWVRMTPDFERHRVLDLLAGAPHHNGIILFHDTIESTAQMLPDLLADLRERGYTIVHLVYDAKAPRPPLEHAAPGWTSETEAIIGRLRRPIVPGSHHAGETAPVKTSKPSAPREGAGTAREEHPARAESGFRCEPDCGGDPGPR